MPEPPQTQKIGAAPGAGGSEAAPHGDTELREELRRFRVLANSDLVGIFQADADGNLIYINECGAAIVGLTPRQAYGRGWVENLHPDDRDRVLAHRRHALESGTPFRSENRFRHANGRIVWVLGRFVPDLDSNGRLLGHIGTLQDITSRKLAEEKLRDSERRYAALAENSVPGIWQIDPRGSTLYINPSMRRMLELDDDNPYDNLPANPERLVYEFILPESRDQMRLEHAKRPKGQASVYEVEIVGKKGGRRDVVVCGAPVLGSSGELTSMIATFTDITARKQMEAALRHNEARLRVMTEQVAAVLWTTDAHLRFTSSVGAALNVMGLRAEQVVGRSIRQFIDRGSDHEAPALVAHRQALLGLSRTYEQTFAGRAYQAHVEPLRGADGAIHGVIGIALDVTDRKKAEDALRDARDWLEIRVRQTRTEEITNAVEALRHEVDERKGVEERMLQSQARYASILNSQQTLVSRSDPHGRITYVNAAHQRTFGSKEGDNVFVNVHPDDVEATRVAMEDLARPPFMCTLEQRCEVRGRWRWFLWQVGVIRDRAGQLIEYQGVGFDITGLKQAEEMLRETTRRARDSASRRAAAERERHAAEEARQVAEFNRRLALELDHRVRNNLAGLLSLVSAMRATTRNVESFAGAIEGRLLSMSHVHQLLAETDWRPVDLRALVTSLLAAAERLCPNRIDAFVQGPPVAIAPRQAPAISMILMELFTNSCKYGAHAVPGGGLRITWEVAPPMPVGSAPSDPIKPGGSPAATAGSVRLRWAETGGQPPRLPTQPSLGSELVKNFATVELHGSFQFGFPETGADHVLEFAVE